MRGLEIAALTITAAAVFGREAAADQGSTCPPGTRPKLTQPPSTILAKWCQRPDRASLGIWGLDQMCAQPPQTRSSGVTQYCERYEGKRHGPFMDFYPSGYAQQVGQYRDGNMDGLWVRWYDGSPRSKAWESKSSTHD